MFLKFVIIRTLTEKFNSKANDGSISKLTIAIITSAVLLLFAYGIYFIYNINNVIINNPRETVGTIKFIEVGRRPTARVYFEVNGELIYGEIAKDSKMVIGEKFIVIYEKNNPTIFQIDEYSPIFVEDESVNSIVGEVTDLVTFGKNSVTFQYVVEGMEYTKFQLYNESIFNPKKGDKYKVNYWLENPQRAIIYLDKPIK
jgi:hypothetical protein